MNDQEEVFYTQGQQALATQLLHWLYRYLPEEDRRGASDLATISECRNRVQQIFEYMDEEWPSDYDELHITDVLEKLHDRIAQLVDERDSRKPKHNWPSTPITKELQDDCCVPEGESLLGDSGYG